MRCCWCQVTSVQMNGYCELNYSDFRVVAYSEENMAADAIARKGFKMADYRTCTVYFTRMDLQSSIRLLTSQYPQFVILLCFLYVGCPDHARAWGSHRAPLASCAGRRTGCTLLWWPSPPTTSATTPPPSSASSQSRNCTVVTRAGAAFLNTFREDQYRVKGGQTSSCVRTTANSSQVLMGVSVLI